MKENSSKSDWVSSTSNPFTALATVAEIYAAYNNRVTKPLLDALADDFEMHEHAPVTVPWGGAWKGQWMHRVVFCDGKIIELHEFADSLSVAEAFGLACQTPLEPHEAEAAKRV